MPGVRRAAPPDLPRLLELAQRSPTAAQWNPDEYAKLFAPETQQNRLALVIEDRAEVAGFIVARQLMEEWEIENIVVNDTARRHGLGSRLLKKLLGLVGNSGAEAIFLEVRESNHAARALYRKHGFAEAGRRKQYYENPAEDALVLKFIFP